VKGIKRELMKEEEKYEDEEENGRRKLWTQH
jgi:hypothetical protein